MELLTPQTIWKGYDASMLPLATSVTSDKTEGGRRVICARFNGSWGLDGVSRVFVRAVLPAGKKSPAVIYMPDAHESVMNVDVDLFLSLGYGVIVPDYAGERDDDPRYTLYPRSMSHANFTPDCLSTVPKDMKFNCWTVWAETLMRAITFASELDEVDESRIALVGEGVGASSAFKASSIDNRIACAVTLYSAGYLPEADEQELLKFKVTLTDEAYAPLIKKPVLILVASNEQDGSVDAYSEAFERIPEESGSRLSISERASHTIGLKQKNNIGLWLAHHLEGEGNIPAVPEVAVSSENRELYYTVTAPSGMEDVELFVSQANRAGALRNWRSYKLTKAEDGTYKAKVEVYNSREPLVAFANATARSGKAMSVSSSMLTRTPAMLGVNETPFTSNRLIYSGEMGKDDWIVISPLLKKNTLSMIKGPFGIEGVSSAVGTISTFKIGDPIYAGKSGWLLQLMIYSNREQDVTFSVTSYNGEGEKGKYTEYSHTVRLYPADNWRKITLEESDFKAPYAGHANWEEVVYLNIRGDAPVAIASALWV